MREVWKEKCEEGKRKGLKAGGGRLWAEGKRKGLRREAEGSGRKARERA